MQIQSKIIQKSTPNLQQMILLRGLGSLLRDPRRFLGRLWRFGNVVSGVPWSWWPLGSHLVATWVLSVAFWCPLGFVGASGLVLSCPKRSWATDQQESSQLTLCGPEAAQDALNTISNALSGAIKN